MRTHRAGSRSRFRARPTGVALKAASCLFGHSPSSRQGPSSRQVLQQGNKTPSTLHPTGAGSTARLHRPGCRAGRRPGCCSSGCRRWHPLQWRPAPVMWAMWEEVSGGDGGMCAMWAMWAMWASRGQQGQWGALQLGRCAS